MDWMHGYYANSGYSYGFYPETMPARLRWAALLQGNHAPAANFRYLDAGCGQGVNLILAAIAHPESEFVGIDFLPEHIAHARQLAHGCGVTNVTFIEGDFVALADDPAALGVFDYAVCHGISTWIQPAVRQSLFRLIGAVLRPGGLFYNGYNTQPGWLSMVPFQHLVLLEQRRNGGEDAIKAAQRHIAGLQEAAPLLDKALPGLKVRLKATEEQDPAYLVQEYNNQFWQPMFVSQMFAAMDAVKLHYLGSATLPESFEGFLSRELRDLLNGQSDPLMREQLRDYATNQAFRRDLYVKGQNKLWPSERAELLRESRFVVNPLAKRPDEGEPFKITGSAMELNGRPEFYNELLDLIAAGKDGTSVGDLIDGVTESKRKAAVVETLSMLLHGGWVLPRLPRRKSKAAQANLAMATLCTQGAPYRFLCLPDTGCSVTMTDLDWIIFKLIGDKVADDRIPDSVVAILKRLGRALARDGKAVNDRAGQLEVVVSGLTKFREQKLPFLQSVGAI
ncbi:class I SAM-dependent methyltransferase [Sphingomonas sp.]|uniref:class I SAM-dependent methyltransferase n=1 Tax=Sphingomonas sp. TaxID=28214 RepID=UPI002BE7F734|nr:class I SAM-dependent methyltransferase [Sphingomonas sp.]HWK36461.1 class I SAM-dependent methyltransferase [Sphingomonas sp.]